MGYRVSYEQMNDVIAKLLETYDVYAPIMDRRKMTRFGRIRSIEQIVTDQQTKFSMKEAYYPVSQSMFVFSDTDIRIGDIPAEKDVLIIGRPCDLNSIKRLDHIFLENGDHQDFFYERMRLKVKTILLECTESYEHCFCVSMKSNICQDYDAAIRIRDGQVLVQVKDDSFDPYFAGYEHADFTPAHVTENKKKINIPEISDRSLLKEISDLEFWKQFDDRCIACGGCNTVCGTCSCFDTVDVIYKEGSHAGERRRLWSSCMLENFTETAGGNRCRKTRGANMRFKIFHKFYDFQQRFGTDYNMCVGCGRCDMRCPQDISFFDTTNQLAAEIDQIKAKKEES